MDEFKGGQKGENFFSDLHICVPWKKYSKGGKAGAVNGKTGKELCYDVQVSSECAR